MKALEEFLRRSTIEVLGAGDERFAELRRIAIVLEEYACRDIDGCWACISLPYCVHSRNVRSLMPYLSKSCVALLAR